MKDESSPQNGKKGQKPDNPYRLNPDSDEPDNNPYKPYRNVPGEEPEPINPEERPEPVRPAYPLGWLTGCRGHVYIEEIVVYYSLN